MRAPPPNTAPRSVDPALPGRPNSCSLLWARSESSSRSTGALQTPKPIQASHWAGRVQRWRASRGRGLERPPIKPVDSSEQRISSQDHQARHQRIAAVADQGQGQTGGGHRPGGHRNVQDRLAHQDRGATDRNQPRLVASAAQCHRSPTQATSIRNNSSSTEPTKPNSSANTA